MRIIATEEHFVTDAVRDAWARLPGADGGSEPPGELGERLGEIGERRIAAMDAAGVEVQVISLTSPGLHDVPAADGRALQTATNDLIAELVAAHHGRLQGFATLAFTDPDAAAAELRRGVGELGLQGALVFGRTGARNLDHADNEPILAAAAELRAPLYVHPQTPQTPVRDAIYSGFSPEIDGAFARFGIGWHYESGIQFMRLALAGAFERHPDLQVILGHWGEVVLFFLERADGLARMAGLPHTFSEYARTNAYVSAGGVYSTRYLRWAAEVVGVERLLFATDYPYRPGPEGGAEAYLRAAGLDGADLEAVAHGNWERLVSEIRR